MITLGCVEVCGLQAVIKKSPVINIDSRFVTDYNAKKSHFSINFSQPIAAKSTNKRNNDNFFIVVPIFSKKTHLQYT